MIRRSSKETRRPSTIRHAIESIGAPPNVAPMAESGEARPQLMYGARCACVVECLVTLTLRAANVNAHHVVRHVLGPILEWAVLDV